MFLSVAEKRRSIRSFQDRAVEKEKIGMLVEAALRAPSSRGIYPWEFVVVSERDLLEKLSKSKPHGAAFLKNAPLAFVISADPEKCDVWIEDAAIASAFIHIAAASLELGSCWIQIRNRPHDDTRSASRYIGELLRLPKRLEVLSIVAVGYPAEEKPPHRKEDLLYGQVHYNRYGS